MASSFTELKPEQISTYEEEILREFNSEQQQDNSPPFWIKRGRRVKHDSFSSVESNSSTDSPLSESPKAEMGHSTKKTDGKKRGRRPSHLDTEAKLERSRQSARECRARKKIRYQHLDDMVASKEEGVVKLWQELDMYRRWCKAVDQGIFPKEMVKFLKAERKK